MASYSSATEQFETSDILDPSSITGNWEACSGTDCWAGTSGGPDPSWNGWTARWSYGMRTLTWTTAINQALQESGLQIDGYQYEWVVKNYNANYGSSQPGTTPDHLIITLNIYNTDNEVVHTKRFDYSYSISDWTSFTGVEYLDQSLATANLSDLEVSAYGDDHGFWAGHYGPEFDVSASSVNLIYSYAPKDPCESIPVTDPTCPNYVTPGLEDTLAITVQDNTIGDNTGEVVIETIPEPNNDSVSEELDAGLGDVVAESSQSGNQEQTQEEQSGSSGGGGLSDAQKNALAAAAAEANAAEQVAAASSELSLEAASEANESAVSATLENSAAMESAESSMNSTNMMSFGSSSSSSQQSQQSMSGSNDGSNQGNNSGESTGYSADMTNSVAGGVGLTGGPELALEITVEDDASVTELSSIVESILKETFKKIQQQSKESATAGLEQKPSDDPAEDMKLAMMQNPDIAQYQQSFLPDAAGYDDKEIYQGQRVIDNPAGRLFNGASDQLHKQMVREQYDR